MRVQHYRCGLCSAPRWHEGGEMAAGDHAARFHRVWLGDINPGVMEFTFLDDAATTTRSMTQGGWEQADDVNR